jgi:hypothetical protein
MAPPRPPRVERVRTLIETTIDQGPIATLTSPTPVEQNGISWASDDGHPLPVRLTFPPPIPKNGNGVGLPRTRKLIGGYAYAIIEYTAGASVAQRVIVDWPMNGRSVVMMASRVSVTLRTTQPNTITAGGQALFPVQLSDAGPVTSRDFAPMTYQDPVEQFVAGPGSVNLLIPQGAVAVLISPTTAGVQIQVTQEDDQGDATINAYTAAAAAGTQRPEQPYVIGAHAQALNVITAGLVGFSFHPTWLIDL